MVVSDMCECSICKLPIEQCISSDKDVENKENTSLLLGNGILLSHPNQKIRDKFKFAYDDIKKKMLETYNQHYQSIKLSCPEELLNQFRVELSFIILEWYIGQHANIECLTQFQFEDDDEPFDFHHFSQFIADFRNVFTVNYDPITYKSIFAETGGANFDDGFVNPQNGSRPLNKIQEYLKKKEKNGLYYLHGAFHIIYHRTENDEGIQHSYKKLVSDNKNNKKLISVIQTKCKEIIEFWRSNINGTKNNSYDDMLCVIESRSISKLSWILDDPYLNFCLKQLGKQNKVLTLGCSFKKDTHLLESILLNEKLKSLCIGVFDEADKQNICSGIKAIKSAPKNKGHRITIEDNVKKISFICTKKLGKRIWPQI